MASPSGAPTIRASSSSNMQDEESIDCIESLVQMSTAKSPNGTAGTNGAGDTGDTTRKAAPQPLVRRGGSELKNLLDFNHQGTREERPLPMRPDKILRSQVPSPLPKQGQQSPQPHDIKLYKLTGRWLGDVRKWSGVWSSSDDKELKSRFTYEPDMSLHIDDDMADQPCTVCGGTDEKGFLFCDLCNRGFHAKCVGLFVIPAEEEDWHCENCTNILRRYGNNLPPSRAWRGMFNVQHGGGSVEKVKEQFTLEFQYKNVLKTLPGENEKVVIAEFHCEGSNKYGLFAIRGTLDKTGPVFNMNCTKNYVTKHQLKKKPLRRHESGEPESMKRKTASPRANVSPRHMSDAKKRKLSQENAVAPRPSASLTTASSSSSQPPKASPANFARPDASTSAFEKNIHDHSGEKKGKIKNNNPPPTTTTTAAITVGVDEDEFLRKSKQVQGGSLLATLRRKIISLEEELFKARGVYKLLVVTDLACFFYPSDHDDDEPTRLTDIWSAIHNLYGSKSVRRPLCWITEPPKVPIDILYKAHDATYIARVMTAGLSSRPSENRLMAALKAAGAVCTAVDRVVPHHGLGDRGSKVTSSLSNLDMESTMRNAVCLVRPAGHCVGFLGPVVKESSRSMSIFNNAAIGAIYAHFNFSERVAVLDLSIFPGYGTMEILNNFCSTLKGRRADDMFYGSVDVYDDQEYSPPKLSDDLPLWQKYSEIKKLSPSAEREDWDKAWKSVLEKVSDYQPSIIVLSAGFEGLQPRSSSVGRSPFGKLDEYNYRSITSQILKVCSRVVSVLEGGGFATAEVATKGVLKHIGAFVSSNRQSFDS